MDSANQYLNDDETRATYEKAMAEFREEPNVKPKVKYNTEFKKGSEDSFLKAYEALLLLGNEMTIQEYNKANELDEEKKGMTEEEKKQKEELDAERREEEFEYFRLEKADVFAHDQGIELDEF